MSEYQKGDRVRVTRVFEGTVVGRDHYRLEVLGHDGYMRFPGLDAPDTTIEKITPPLPDEPGTVLWYHRCLFYVRGVETDSFWISSLGNAVSGQHMRAEWEKGHLTTERPA